MKNLKHSDVFLKFTTRGEDRFVSVNDILISGNPIDADAGDDLEQADDLVYRKEGKTFVAIRA